MTRKFTLWLVFGLVLTTGAAALIIGSGMFEKKVRGTAQLYIPTSSGKEPCLATSDRNRAYLMVKTYQWQADGTAIVDTAYGNKLGPDVISLPVGQEVEIFRVLKDSVLAEIRARWTLDNGNRTTYIGYVPYRALQATKMNNPR